MKFQEKGYQKIPTIPNCLIYFLVKNEDVVYVGQTKNGIARPLQHKYEKDFDDIYIIPCNEKQLDYEEDKYIRKYNPKYNKQLNTRVSYSLTKIRDNIKSKYKNFDLRILKKIIKELNIPTSMYDTRIVLESKYQNEILKYYEEVMLNGKH